MLRFTITLIGLFSLCGVAAKETSKVSDGEKHQIDTWLKSQGESLNKFGDAADTMYAGGSPLFDETTGEMRDLHSYILSKHPSQPWAATEAKVEQLRNQMVEDAISQAAKDQKQSEQQADQRRTVVDAPQATAEKAASEEEKREDAEEEGGMGSVALLGLAGIVAAAGGGFLVMKQRGPSRAKGSAVLITGPSNSGKTALYLTLKDGKIHSNATVTSMVHNEGNFIMNGYDDDDAKPTHFIDYPGDPGLGFRLPDFYPLAKVIVFMVDANDKKSIEREAAECLFRILTNPAVAEQEPTILIGCNKSDLIMRSKPALLKKIFEAELQKLSVTQGIAEDTVTEEAEERETVPLGNFSDAFEFDKHSPCSFVECSVTKGNLKELVTKIQEALDD